ncbi:decaprenyl-phosphate phosphoribosyltransferase [candidate division WWE3 bacterium]|nr:decaprenyl-phosphate phosphoribosyltransferase [candidate division WWE3 bacterium]
MLKMIGKLYQIVRTARPRQWLKNLSVFAAPFFSGALFSDENIWTATKCFIAFSAISSGAYFINDINDVEKDRKHPVKKNRPIASGKVGIKTAWVIAVGLILFALVFAYTAVGTFFTLSVIAYIVMQFLYSLYFRNVIILDSLVVATGFVIRVFAGGFGTNTSLSSWLALTTIGLSLLMAFGKRRSEKTLLRKFNEEDGDTRKTLRHYPDTLLDSMISMSSSLCIMTYALFTFQVSPQGAGNILTELLPSTLRSPKWMMLTIPVVIYGVARYLYVIYEREEGESPARVLLSDKPLFFTVILWGLVVMGIIYALPAA